MPGLVGSSRPRFWLCCFCCWPGVVALLPLFARIAEAIIGGAVLPPDLWLLDENRINLFSVLLIAIFFIFTALSRWQIMRNPDLWAGNGCPECQHTICYVCAGDLSSAMLPGFSASRSAVTLSSNVIGRGGGW